MRKAKPIELRERLLALLVETGNVALSCERLGISDSLAYSWRHDPDYRRRWDETLAPWRAAQVPRRARSGAQKRQRKLPKPLSSGVLSRAASAYDPAYLPRITKLLLLGLTLTDVADTLGIAPNTLQSWRRRPEVEEAIRAGMTEADAEVAASMHQRAKGYDRDAVKIFLDPDSKQPIYAHYQEHYPADYRSGSLWLRNRQRHLWRERQEVDMMGSIEHRVAMMTPEERRARLLELHAKAAETLIEGQIIDGEGEVEEEGDDDAG